MPLKIIRLRDKSKTIQLNGEEALKEALNSEFRKDEVLIIIWDDESCAYEFWQSGSQSIERMLWHAEQFKQALLDGRLNDRTEEE